MNEPRLSVIMPVFNAAPYFRAAVQSVLDQTLQEFELIIVDDGSTDGSPAIVASITDSRIRFFKRGNSSGPAAARNLGLTEARGRFIAFFDSDDLAAPTMLAELFQFLATNPSFQIVGGWLQPIGEDGIPAGEPLGYRDRSGKLASSMLFSNGLVTSCMLMERRCVGQERFDPGLTIASDYDLWARLVIKSKAHVLPRVLGSYRVHSGNITHRKQDSASECLERIYRSQLVRLGIQPTSEEIALHMQLTGLTFGTPRQTVVAAEGWLLKLDRANALAGLYEIQPFRETLGDIWYGVCHSACGNGFWTWRRFFASPLSQWISPTVKQRYQLFKLSARGALKNIFSASHRSVSVLPS